MTRTIVFFLLSSAVYGQQPRFEESWVHPGCALNGDIMTTLSYSPSRRLLVSTTGGSCSFWNPASKPVLVARKSFLRASAYCSTVSRSDSDILVGMSDGSIQVFDLLKAKWNTFDLSFGSSILYITASHDGSLVCVTCQDGSLHLIDWQLKHETGIWQDAGACSLSDDGSVLLASLKNSLCLISVANKSIIHKYANFKSDPWCLHFNGVFPNTFAAVWGGGLIVMDTNGSVIGTWPSINTLPSNNAISWSTDGRLLSASSLSSISIVRPSSSQVFSIPVSDGASYLTFLGSDTIVACGQKDISMYSASKRSFLTSLSGHNAEIGSVLFSKDGKDLLSAASDGQMKRWKAEDGTLEETNMCAAPIIAASGDLNKIVSAGQFGELTLYSPFNDSGHIIREANKSGGPLTPHIVFSPTDSLFVVGFQFEPQSGYQDTQNVVELWSATTNEKIRTLPGPHYPISHVAFSQDGSKVGAIFEVSGQIYVWSVTDGSLVDSTVQIDPNFNWLGAPLPFNSKESVTIEGRWNRDSIVEIIDRQSGDILNSFSSSSEYLSSFAASPVTGDIATGGVEGTLVVWKLDHESAVKVPELATARSLQVSIRNCQIKIYTEDKRGELFVYSITGQCVWDDRATNNDERLTPQLPAGVYFVVFQSTAGERRFAKVSLFE